jgi:AcrR family transcriptional regulator/DNA-binding XRE family transcriptional regulator
MDANLVRALAGNVQRLRRVLGWSQAQLARESALAKATVSMVEAGTANPALSTLAALAAALGVTVPSLVADPVADSRPAVPRPTGPRGAEGGTGTPVPPDRDAAGESTRSRILDAVIVLYRKRGYEGTSMAAVAQELGMTAASLYYHYRSKEDILFAAMRRALRRVLDNARAAAAHPDPADRLRALTRVHVDYQLRQIEQVGPAAYGAEHLKEHLTPDRRRELNGLQRATFELMRDTIADGIRAGRFAEVDATAAAFAVFGMCEHVMYWFHRAGELDRESLSALYGELAVRMVTRVDRSIK